MEVKSTLAKVEKIKIIFTKDASENEALCRNPTIFENVEVAMDEHWLVVDLSGKDYDVVAFPLSNIVAVYFKDLKV